MNPDTTRPIEERDEVVYYRRPQDMSPTPAGLVTGRRGLIIDARVDRVRVRWNNDPGQEPFECTVHFLDIRLAKEEGTDNWDVPLWSHPSLLPGDEVEGPEGSGKVEAVESRRGGMVCVRANHRTRWVARSYVRRTDNIPRLIPGQMVSVHGTQDGLNFNREPAVVMSIDPAQPVPTLLGFAHRRDRMHNGSFRADARTCWWVRRGIISTFPAGVNPTCPKFTGGMCRE